MNNMRVEARISLDNILYNLESMHAHIKPSTKMIDVIKTDGYGHGAIQIAEKTEKLDYIWGHAVAAVSEAVLLREAGVRKPVLILGFTFPECYETLVKEEIRMAVFKYDMAKALSEEAVKQGKNVYFHIKLDTGMGRIGYEPGDEAVDEILAIAKLPNVVLEGVFTHFAKADMTDKEPTIIQIQKFHDFVSRLELAGVHFDYKHCSNSAGIIRFPEANDDIVRAGITLYGLWPSDETERDILDLKPVMELKSHIAYIKNIKAGKQISYGGTYEAKKGERIATIPVGYGDGYPRALSNKGYVLINGKKAPIRGRVCMDQFMVDVTDIPEAKEFDEVTLIGRDGNEEITMEYLGDISGRFNYELACDIGKRVPRVYS